MERRPIPHKCRLGQYATCRYISLYGDFGRVCLSLVAKEKMAWEELKTLYLGFIYHFLLYAHPTLERSGNTLLNYQPSNPP